MKDGRHIIWSNDIDYDDWREDLEEQYCHKFLWHVLSPLSILVCIQGCTAHLALKIGGKYNEKNCDYFRRSFHRI